MPRNPIFTAIHAALAEWLLEQRHTTLAPGEDEKAYQAHRAIFEAVASRDPDRAERAMRDHLEYVARRYTDIVEAARMSGFVIIVDFRLKAGAHAEFRRLVDANADASVRNEPGCRRFDVVEPRGEPDRVLLYEIYDDEAAFDEHCRSAHYARFDRESAAAREREVGHPLRPRPRGAGGRRNLARTRAGSGPTGRDEDGRSGPEGDGRHAVGEARALHRRVRDARASATS